MRFTRMLVAAVLSVSLSGCFSGRGLIKQSDKDVAPFSLNTLNGVYENVLPDDLDYSLWQDLSANEQIKEVPPSIQDSQVELELVNDNTLMAYLLIAGQRIDTLEIKGRVKNDYFIANRVFTIVPFILLNYYADHKTVLGNLPNGDLHLVQGKKVSFVFFEGSGDSDREVINADYQRADPTQVRILKRNL